ncbi:helix-turn-helix domain-containing protein [Nocardiopsis sp. CNT-189]|uniref:Scr1 family TA system antitoxin-like transcriptional regulator n=1 Tax=Nocardiopsis oceanisediminis TaxID=2816862 RepID=UPI003B2E3180
MTKKAQPQWRRFGRELRRRRELAGLTQDQLGKLLSTTYGTISAIERAIQRPKLELVEGIDHELSADGALIRVWHTTNDGTGLASWFRGWAELIRKATELREYNPMLIPGLLQTEAYARTILRAGQPGYTDEQIEEQVAARIERQSVLASPSAPHLIEVIDESVLRRPIGGHAIMKDQLTHLLDATSGARVDVHVLPFDTEHHPGLSEAFSVVKVPEHGEVLYMETRIAATPVDDHEQVASYTAHFADLRGASLPLQASRKLIERIRGDFT